MNLLSKLHKNSILTGPIESFCLICSCVLRSEEACYAHITEEEHLVKLEAVHKLENFKDDGIIKSKEGYYCPYCNILLPTIKRVGLHVTDRGHLDNRVSQSIRRQTGHILYDSVAINEKSWNGLDGATCFVCNEDYSDEEDHTTEVTHVLKLIQSRCEFGSTFIYRKVDDDSFFCLICGNFYSNEEKSTHHESENHIEHYNSSKKLGTDVLNKQNDEPNNNCIPSKAVQESIETKNDTLNYTKPKLSENTGHQVNGNIISKTENVEDKKADNTKDAQELNSTNTFSQATTKLNGENNQASHVTNIAKTGNDASTAKAKTDVGKTANDAETNVAKTMKAIKSGVAEIVNTVKTDVAKAVNTVKTVNAAKNYKANVVNNNQIKEPPIYEFLQARDFVVIMNDGSYCTLCDASIKKSIDLHRQDEHHKVLYAKHMARKAAKNKQPKNEANDKTDIHKTKEKVNLTEHENTQVIEANGANGKPSVGCLEQNNNKTQTKAVLQQGGNKTQPKAQVTETNKSVVANTTNNVSKDSKDVTVLLNNKAKNKNQTDTLQLERVIVAKGLDESKSTAQSNNKTETAVLENNNKTEIGKENVPISNINGQQKLANENMQNKTAAKKAKKILKRAARARSVARENIIEQKEVTLVSEPNNYMETSLSEDMNAKAQETLKEVTDRKGTVDNNELPPDSKTGPDDMKLEKLSIVLKTASQFDNSSDDLVINGEYVLGNLSFMLVVHEGTKYTCVACNVDMIYDEVHKHIAIEQHRNNVGGSQVVTSFKDEFIRQVDPLKFHCGFCNIAAPTWPDMQLHLSSFRHDDAKTSAAWRLERYHPHLRHCTMREVRNILCSVTRATRE